MKKISILFLFLISLSTQAQEIKNKEVKSNIAEVSVFIKGAQINRTANVQVENGETLLKFTALSPFIDAKSLQVKTNGNGSILSVNFQKNYLSKQIKSKEISNLQDQLKAIDKKIKLEQTYLNILQEELVFLKENRVIGGKNQELTVSNLKEAAAFYSSKLTTIKLKEIGRNETLEKLRKERSKLNAQIQILSSDKDFPSGEIWVKIESAKTQKIDFKLSYMVENAGWLPSYDIKAKSIADPIEIVYKANVHQDTKVDWKDVKISFSSANPSSGATAPELKPYYLNYNSRPPQYNQKFNEVSGQVVSAADGSPLPGASLVFKGTTIGTTSDMDGRYSLALPNNTGLLECHFIGMRPMQKIINSPNVNFSLESDEMMLNEVMTVENLKSSRSQRAKSKSVRIRGASSLKNNYAAAPPPSFQVENQTSFAFELEKKYSLKSDNKTQTVVMNVISVDASYQYFAIPKIDKDAFLKAYITDWEKLNLLEGEANLFFENTFIGKSVLDTRTAGDTLAISLGRDKNVQINRVKQKSSSSKQFIGNKKEEVKAWAINLKNNKQLPINIILLDQVPVPTMDEIEFKLIEKTGAKFDAQTGELKWELKLDALKNKKLQVKYSLKYPKNRNLILD